MTRQVLYVAAPLRPTEEEIDAIRALHGQGSDTPTSTLRTSQAMEANIQRALCWLAWLRKSFPETTFIAPWIANVLAGEDGVIGMGPDGVNDSEAVVERCDGIVLCGGRISSGMRREMEHGMLHVWSAAAPFRVYDLTGYSADPPGVFEPDDDGAHREFTANATPRTREDAERLWRLGRKV